MTAHLARLTAIVERPKIDILKLVEVIRAK